ncbi:MAG: ATP-binding cassette domain-containing protein, partial [Gammaproteobacteria bacterium]|nr:ATP-binding cassette domain-containing protein [Gammaproteobacteria bacterium]
HVPQNIYLSDSTIAENIAFGIKKEDINRDDVRQAAKYAQIDDFIQQTEDSYDTVIGEFGIRLSGGQRQRIGIARALYKPSEILILDEATSSLDNATEAAVVKSLESLDNGLTIIIVAHRISTVMECDIIFELKDGMICNQGTYKELLGKSESFRDMVKILEEADSERLSKDD